MAAVGALLVVALALAVVVPLAVYAAIRRETADRESVDRASAEERAREEYRRE